jgi:hypothetical protein
VYWAVPNGVAGNAVCQSLTVPGYVFVVVIVAMIAVAVLTILAGRRQRAKDGTYNSEALGFVGGVFNALFIVVLAFYTVITWTEADATKQSTVTEASGLTEMYWQVAEVPEPDQSHIRALIREYTAAVVDREWPALANGEFDQKAEDLLITLRAEISRIPPATEDATAARDEALQTIRAVTDERRARVDQATHESLLLKLLLLGTVIGAAAMIGYPLLIGFSADFRHIAGLVLLAGVLAFVIYFSVELDQPFSGLLRVEPDAFRTALAEYPRIP